LLSVVHLFWVHIRQKAQFQAISGLVKEDWHAQRGAMAGQMLNKMIFSLARPYIFFAAILIGGDSIPNSVPAEFASLTVEAQPLIAREADVSINPDFPAKLVRAWSLRSDNEDFGGLSAIHASGNSLTMLSDKGTLVRLGVDARTPRWKGSIALLPKGCGNMRDKGQRDTESLAADPRTGTLWIGFESRNAICRIAINAQGGTRFANPRFMAHWDVTSGAEAMVRLRDGRFLVFQEKPDTDSSAVEVLGYTADPVRQPNRMTVMRLGIEYDFLPVDAAELPDGRLLLLARRFRLPFEFTSRLYLVDPIAWRDDATFRAREVMRIDRPRMADNYEGIAIDPAGGRVMIWLVSDDNFLGAQRSLLLQLELPLPFSAK
jgi:hypothetical protein